jgi:hypothetical protein
VSEGKALTLVVVGTVVLSAVIDIALLAAHAGGAALAVGLVAVLALCSVVTNAVMGRYDAQRQRHEREAALLH